MSTQQTPKQETPKGTKAPAYALFHIEERGEQKAFWSEVAVGWKNTDGSVNLRTNVGAVLLPGQTYQLRTRKGRNGNGERSE